MGKSRYAEDKPSDCRNVIFGVANRRFVALEKINATTC